MHALAAAARLRAAMPPRKGKKGRGKAEVGEKTSPAGPPTKPAAPLDILILAGQSNIAGRGELRADDAWPRGDVARFSAAGLWEPAKDPLHADVDLRKAAQCGVGPALAGRRRPVWTTPSSRSSTAWGV